ncbi:MAG: DedA family protein [Candidatus Nanoarchaeia archaeon]
MLQIASFLIDLIVKIGYIGLFCLSAGESALLPIPSEIILPFSGYLVWQNKMVFSLAATVAILGQLLGSVLAYALGYYGGRPLVLRYGRYFFLSKAHFEHVERWFNKNGAITVFIARLLPFVRTVISFPAGVTKLNFRKFLLYSFLGIALWTIALIYTGIRLGESWQILIGLFNRFQIIIIFALAAFVVWWLWKELKEQANENQTNS